MEILLKYNDNLELSNLVIYHSYVVYEKYISFLDIFNVNTIKIGLSLIYIKVKLYIACISLNT